MVTVRTTCSSVNFRDRLYIEVNERRLLADKLLTLCVFLFQHHWWLSQKSASKATCGKGNSSLLCPGGFTPGQQQHTYQWTRQEVWMCVCVLGSKLETPVRGSGVHENRLKGFIQLSSHCRQSLLSDSRAIQRGHNPPPPPQCAVHRLHVWAVFGPYNRNYRFN